MNEKNINQIDIFDLFFTDGKQEEATTTQPEPVTPNQKVVPLDRLRAMQPKETPVSCGEEPEETTCGDEEDADLPDFVAMELEGDDQEAGNSKVAASAPKEEPKKKFEEIDQQWTVCYAGQRLPIQQKGISLEKIRKMLETEFPELTKERTEMMFDEKKAIVIPVVKGAKKGAVTC